MSIFSKLFGTGKNGPAVRDGAPMTVYAPAEGTVIPLAQFPDGVFSQGILGPGCGILPAGSEIRAPFQGTVLQAAETLHAVGLTSDDGVELLIHVGVDTVDMGGNGFVCHVKSGQRVRLGEKLMEFDRAVIQAAGHCDAIAVVVTNGDAYAAVDLLAEGAVSFETRILKANA